MLAEIAQGAAIEERHGSRGDENLVAVPRCRNSGGAMDVRADVALLGQERRARVNTDANAHRARVEALDDRLGSSERARRSRKRDEECVPLRVDLDSTLERTRFADDPPMLRECRGVVLGAELVEQPGGSLDVGEEERDGAGR
jgi:hypothetical protein